MKLTWDDAGSRIYEAGVDRGVFYPKIGPGVPWNGLTSVKESVEGDGTVVIYVDGQKIVNQVELGQFTADISAITYPDEMYPYDGFGLSPSGQSRPAFNLSYRSMIGNDVEGLSYGYRLHLVFNCLLTPTNREYISLNNGSEMSDFEWKITTIPVATPYNRPTSHFYIQTDTIEQEALVAIENILYGQSGIDPRMPTVAEILAIFETNAIFTVVDNGNGMATITGPDDWVFQVATNKYEISSPSVVNTDATHVLATSY